MLILWWEAVKFLDGDFEPWKLGFRALLAGLFQVYLSCWTQHLTLRARFWEQGCSLFASTECLVSGHLGFPSESPTGLSVLKNLPANGGKMGSIPGWGRYPEKGNGNPLQYSFQENSMARGAWRVTVHGIVKESDN